MFYLLFLFTTPRPNYGAPGNFLIGNMPGEDALGCFVCLVFCALFLSAVFNKRFHRRNDDE